MFIEAMLGAYRDQAELVGFCDVSQTRMNAWNRRIIAQFGCQPIPTYLDDQFETMVRQQRAHAVIVTSVDCTHHLYIIKGMELGCNVITEKPLTVDVGKMQAIVNTQRRTGCVVHVAFNARYVPGATLIRQLLMDGAIGSPLAVDFAWTLDTSHGADYFRRWHRDKSKSGGLLVHKATHHFDLINFWVKSRPARVYAHGELKFYGRQNAEARGERYAYDRYTGMDQARNDPFAIDLTAQDDLRAMYYDAEGDSGYVRDQNVFGDNITAEDTMHVLAKYQNGVMLNYSLLAYSPWEGGRVAITGTRGRIEWFHQKSAHVIDAPGADAGNGTSGSHTRPRELRVFPMFKAPYDVPVPEGSGGHEGADDPMLQQLLCHDPPVDPLARKASLIDGVNALLLGVAANESIRTGDPINVDGLLASPVVRARHPRAQRVEQPSA